MAVAVPCSGEKEWPLASLCVHLLPQPPWEEDVALSTPILEKSWSLHGAQAGKLGGLEVCRRFCPISRVALGRCPLDGDSTFCVV